jgi:hypothetical protein
MCHLFSNLIGLTTIEKNAGRKNGVKGKGKKKGKEQMRMEKRTDVTLVY